MFLIIVEFNLATKDETKEDRSQKRGKKGKMKKVKAKYKDQVKNASQYHTSFLARGPYIYLNDMN